MSIFGKLIADVVESVIDVADLSIGVTKDVVKVPVRLFELTEDQDVEWTRDTREAIEEIKRK